MEKFYYICVAGLGDRLTAIGIMLALKELGFCIEIFWPPDYEHFPTPFDKLFQPCRNINTHKLSRHIKFFRKRLNSFKVFSIKYIEKSMAKNGYPEKIINAVRDYGTEPFKHLCAQKIKKLEPLISINAEVESFRKKHFTGNMVGLHIRSTDKIDRYKDGQYGGVEKYKTIINELHQEIEKEICKNKKFFLCSDNADSKKEYADFIINRGGDVVVHKQEYNKENFRQTSGQSALIDMLLLSKCELTLGVMSDFRFMASYIWGSNTRFWNGNSVDLTFGFKGQKYIKNFENRY